MNINPNSHIGNFKCPFFFFFYLRVRIIPPFQAKAADFQRMDSKQGDTVDTRYPELFKNSKLICKYSASLQTGFIYFSRDKESSFFPFGLSLFRGCHSK